MPTIRTTLDPDNLPKPSSKALAKFDAIADADIDFSDIPELTEDFFAKAGKVSVTARFDADLVSWFKSQGAGYQTRTTAYCIIP